MKTTCRHLATILATAVFFGLVTLATPASAQGSLAEQEQAMLDLVNAERARHGLSALTLNPELQEIARKQASAMATEGRIFHTADLAAEANSRGLSYTLLGENVGVGGSVEAVQQAFLDSPGHRANIVEPKFNAVAIGAASSNGSLYFSQNFAALRAPAAPKAAPAKPASAAKAAKSVTAAKPAPQQTAKAAVAPAPAAAKPAARAPLQTTDAIASMDRFPLMAGVATGAGADAPVAQDAPRSPVTRLLALVGIG